MMNKKSDKKLSAVDKALLFFKMKLDDGTWKTGDRLPALRDIAAMAGVGQTSIEQAVKILQQGKKLIAKQKIGIYVGSSVPQKQKLSPKKALSKWQIIVDILSKDILSGQFGTSDVLPSIKELSTRYRVDYRTLQKALQQLGTDNLIILQNAHYRIVHMQFKSAQKVICFLVSSTVIKLELPPESRQIFDQFVFELEKECSLKSLDLIKYAWTPGFCIDSSECVGFVVWHSPDMNDIVSTMSNWLKKQGKPVAVYFPHFGFENETKDRLDYLESWWNRHGFFISDRSRFLHAGFEMGTFLYSKGHKKLCFLVHGFNSNMEMYLQGIQDVYNAAGQTDAIVLIAYTDLNENDVNVLPTEQDHIFEKSIQSEVDFLDAQTKTFAQSLSFSQGKRLSDEIQHTKFIRNQRSFMTPLFRKALLIKDVTTWICYDDFLACYGALEFLNAEGIDVPKKIGIVGCNNLTEASLHNLTTWHFDLAGTVRKMISLILFPEHSRKSLCIKGSNIFEVDGMVIDRGSV